jgi:integrase
MLSQAWRIVIPDRVRSAPAHTRPAFIRPSHRRLRRHLPCTAGSCDRDDEPTAARLGASERPYNLRHTFTSLMIASGAATIAVASQLGHDASLTLGTYARLFDEFDLASRPDPTATLEAARRAQGQARAQR